MSSEQQHNYSFEWCRENLFSAEKLKNYLKSDQYAKDVQSHVTYFWYDNVMKGIWDIKINANIFEKRKLFEIILDNHPKIDIKSIFDYYLIRIANFRCGTKSLGMFAEYTKIIKLFTRHYFDPKILSKSSFLTHMSHFDVLNQLFHAGVDVNVVYFSVRIPYFDLVVGGSTMSAHHFVLKKLLQTDVRIEGYDKRKCLLVRARYDRALEDTLISTLLIEFS